MAASRVVIADDHAPTRQLVRGSLEDAGFEVCADAHDAAGAVRAVVEHDADVALLDVRMPGGGIAAAAEISMVHPRTAVVMLTVSNDDADLFASITAGAVGYLLKGLSHDELSASLRTVLDGESVLPPALVRRVLAAFRANAQTGGQTKRRRKSDALTVREREVLGLLEEGLTTAQMAERLFVGQVTIRSHIAAILRKLEVPDRSSAIELARHEGGTRRERYPPAPGG